MNKFKIVFGLLGLYLISAGVSYVAMGYLAGGTKITTNLISPAGLSGQRAKVDTSAPKTAECPLNGKMFTEAEKSIWTQRRPLGVMIENHEDSRPQSGLSKADVVYEAIAEGGITRFLAVFYCGASSEEIQIGPVRSARVYYMDWVSELGNDPLYVHVGGANKPGPADALGFIKKYGWDLYNDINQFSIGFPTFWRDYERLGRPVATEHTMYSTTDKLWKVAEDRGLTNKDEDGVSWDEDFVQWKFKDGQTNSSAEVTKISFPFWAGYTAYTVAWTYDASLNTYKRENGEQLHKDFNNDVQISTSNVVIMFQKIKGPIDELKHMLYTTTGTGRALVFQNGEVVEGNWKKASRTERTIFIDKKGKEVQFVRGPIWIEVADTTTTVEY
ncbi:MAG: hypothetical protein A3D24_03650 [Candidatus Blackburnbacteria bacterium RIFCSPHIGHO2_02_FULL_39_13]|uniref:DUF3048 domain-containing protein n=1 Tax=Candidatus Blackburnbacteria bacterium RIFCSPLOWO2_01_FULL_40_20 TaxID=1797519 RepID=A0A1G1VEG6_9BACT|nr:MAG: hypothetical protein A2694_01250 [Candidatus Blackburnbacteria bacterium RIFCSPHIGHO2_01_FULL_40_17]OGY09997.1 MAG: hypothetical protein A3D24_03650 [Candidatus Blackburnbacteria bacterium RIFCSPHIGHO2_02_FULL_39_13]OGY13843.1 MAG: hypothetical protein A3A77_03640 [Candidatus Blackburnbacteria bacterium RIFCSPLOWO2_01_FULL_40_20]HBL52023.1 hypothetical protein [Candidatus Blackburnbacteria bacterium]